MCSWPREATRDVIGLQNLHIIPPCWYKDVAISVGSFSFLSFFSYLALVVDSRCFQHAAYDLDAKAHTCSFFT